MDANYVMLNPDDIKITVSRRPGLYEPTVYTAKILRTEQAAIYPEELRGSVGDMGSLIEDKLCWRIWNYFYADIMDDFYHLAHIAMTSERYGHEAREIYHRMEEKLKPKDL